MESSIVLLLVAVAGLITGIVIAKLFFRKNIKRQKAESVDKARMILKEAEIKADNLKREKILQAKEQYLKLKSEFETETNRKKNQLISNERKLKQWEQNPRNKSKEKRLN